jgi:cytochrome c oxidase cbb3-type subunit 3
MGARAWRVLGILVLLALVWHSQPSAQPAPEGNPYTSAADVKAGARVFKNQCAICHGLDGTGEAGPDLTRREYRNANDDSSLFRLISRGISGTIMTDMRLSDRQAWRALAYLRTLQRQFRPQLLSGDPLRGRILFEGKGKCQNCHMIDGSGGRLGPDLSDVGWQRAPRYLRESILDPSEEISPSTEIFADGSRRYWPVRATLSDGSEVDAVILNEDTYSIQIMDEDERLLSFRKENLKAIRKGEVSAMPSYQDTLSESELDDLIAYLASLRKE